MNRRQFAFAASALLLASPAFAQAPIPLRVGYDGASMTTSPMMYAQKNGIFKKHGLDITITYIDGGPTLTQAVIGGSVDIGQNGYTSAAAAAVQGADLVFIGGISNKLPFQLVVKNEIRTAAGTSLKVAEPRATGMEPRPPGTIVTLHLTQPEAVGVFRPAA